MEAAEKIVESESEAEDMGDRKTLADVESTLTSTIDLRLAKLHELQAEQDRRRVEEEIAKKQERARAASKQAALLEQLLTAQVAEQEERAKKQATLNKILGTLLAVVTAGSGAGIYLGTRVPSDEEKARQAAPVVQTVEKKTGQVEQRVEKAEKKIEKLGEIAVELQVQQSDGIEYIGSKIDAAHPRQAGDVKRPESVEAAKRKADKIKARRGAAELFDFDEAAADPFSGI